jgi:hypothetical protein
MSWASPSLEILSSTSGWSKASFIRITDFGFSCVLVLDENEKKIAHGEKVA